MTDFPPRSYGVENRVGFKIMVIVSLDIDLHGCLLNPIAPPFAEYDHPPAT
jgi:hypothetical protein